MLRVVFCAVVFSSSWSGVELRVMRPICRMLVYYFHIFSYLFRYLMNDMGLLRGIKSEYQHTVELHT